MDPKISKKTQDSLGKFIKKPPLTEKLLSKPPFRFLHDVMTSVIKSTGVMKGLYTESELNSENVKDRDSKIAFLQKALDYVSAATGKQMSAKPAKVVAGHEPEKTNEFLQGLAQVIASKVDNDEIISKMNNKGEKSGSKKEEKEEKPKEREKSSDGSSDRRKKDEEKSREPAEEKERSKDREDRHKDREDRHRDRDKDDKNKRRDEKSKDRENKDRDRDRERERESRHKSGRSRLSKTKNRNIQIENQENAIDESAKLTPDEIDSDILLSGDEVDDGTLPGNATFAVLRPSQVFRNQNFPTHPESPQVLKPIPRQLSTYQENTNAVKPEEIKNIHKTIGDGKEDETPKQSVLEAEIEDRGLKMDHPQTENGHKMNRPKAARPRRSSKTLAYDDKGNFHTPSKEPVTPNVSENDLIDVVDGSADKNENVIINSDDIDLDGSKKKKIRSKGKKASILSGKDKALKKFPRTSTPNESPQSPKKDLKHHKNLTKTKMAKNSSPVKQTSDISGSRRNSLNEQNLKNMRHPKKEGSKTKQTGHKSSKKVDIRDTQSEDLDNKRHRELMEEGRSKDDVREVNTNEESLKVDRKLQKLKEKLMYRNDDYAHEKVKATKRREERDRRKGNPVENGTKRNVDKEAEKGDKRMADEEQIRSEINGDEYYKKKKPRGVGDQRRRSSFTSILDSPEQKKEEEGKENDAPKENLVNGEHKPNDAPAKMQRPTSAKGSRRRMEEGILSSDEDVPSQKQEPTLGDDDLPPQIQGRLARPSSARPAPPKRKEDIVSSEPAMRLGSGKPQNLILDDGKDSDEDETFVVEESAPHQEEPQQPPAPLVDDDDEDHGGLVKKIMESKKEYEQPRETKIERPTISDAQRRKQREAVQREIDKLRGSIQTLTRSANPLGKIMDYVQEDLDSMQKELEKWKEENKEHALALKREKAITERAVEPLRAQLTEVDQAIKDQLDLIGAVKSNIIRNDQKIEKMLRTIAKS